MLTIQIDYDADVPSPESGTALTTAKNTGYFFIRCAFKMCLLSEFFMELPMGKYGYDIFRLLASDLLLFPDDSDWNKLYMFYESPNIFEKDARHLLEMPGENCERFYPFWQAG